LLIKNDTDVTSCSSSSSRSVPNLFQPQIFNPILLGCVAGIIFYWYYSVAILAQAISASIFVQVLLLLGVMASRLLLLPGGLTEGHIDRIHQQPLWGSLWPGRNRGKQPWYVCICEAGRGGRRWESEGLQTSLERLLQPTPDCRPIVRVVNLDWDNIADHLARCDVFYMCGGEPRVFAEIFRRYQSTMNVLESIIRSGQILYVGSCGGSCMVSSSYAGVRTLQLIPGMISISGSELQIENHTGEFPPVTLTKQTGLMLHGEEPQGFVFKKTGVWKHQHLAKMLEQQVLSCFRLANSDAPAEVVETPPPPPPVPPPPPPPPPPVLPSPVPTQPRATSATVTSATATSATVNCATVTSADHLFASPKYVVRHLNVGEHLINMYIPFAARAETTQNRRVVLYLSSTVCEDAPISDFHGTEIVYAPKFINCGRKPWKNAVPDWLLNWVAEAQVDDPSCRWSLFGFSRGAAWGTILADDVRLTFHRVLLVAPYVLPSCSDVDRHKLTVKLPMYGGDLCIAFGSADPWKACSLFQAIQQTCRSKVFEGIGHQTSLAKAVQELWEGLIF
jgi:hypothetical protein